MRTVGLRDAWGHWRFIAVLGAFALVLAACTSDENGEEAQGATGDAAQGGGAGQFCEGTNIVFFPGGTEGGGFETVVYNGARAAESAFGPTITYQWSDWDPAKMISQFSEAM